MTTTEAHNSYAWIKPDAEACHLCGKKEFSTPVDGFQVEECDKCERPICQECCESDYDLQGDPGTFVCTQWVCKGEAWSECLRLTACQAFDAACDEIYARLADNLEAIDRKHGVGPYDYSMLRTPIADIRQQREAA